MRVFLPSAAGVLSMLPTRVSAAVFDGGGIAAGVQAARNIRGLSHRPLREAVIIIMINLLNFLSLAAVIVIVSAGVWLVLGFGEESSRDQVKRMIVYTLIGLVIVFFARLMVSFVLNVLKTGA